MEAGDLSPVHEGEVAAGGGGTASGHARRWTDSRRTRKNRPNVSRSWCERAKVPFRLINSDCSSVAFGEHAAILRSEPVILRESRKNNGSAAATGAPEPSATPPDRGRARLNRAPETPPA